VPKSDKISEITNSINKINQDNGFIGFSVIFPDGSYLANQSNTIAPIPRILSKNSG
jgi:hypothetical protein